MQFLFSTRGRITRLQWWLGGLVPLIIWVCSAVIVVGLDSGSAGSVAGATTPLALGVLALTFVVTVWINLCLAVKRFHDRGKSGWWYLIIFVPFIGTIWLVVELGLLAGDYGTNEYGPEPGSASASDLEAELAAMYGQPSTSAEPRGASHAGSMAATTARPQQLSQPTVFGRAPARVSFGQRGS